MAFLNNPNSVLHRTILVEQPDENLHRDLKEVVRTIVGDDKGNSLWKVSSDDDITVTTLTGGITNVLFLVEITGSEERVIVRLYGQGTSQFIDRSVENIVFSCLSNWNIGPKFYGRFENGRVEGYLPATALHNHEMKSDAVYPFIAQAVAELHSLDIDEIKSEGWLWSKIKCFINLAEGKCSQCRPVVTV